MSSSLKKIQINPDLFKVPSKKTRKSGSKEATNPQLINPNVLKNKLLTRIKQHKANEINNSHHSHKSHKHGSGHKSHKHGASSGSSAGASSGSSSGSSAGTSSGKSDEFNDSIHFFSELTKKQHNKELTSFTNQKRTELQNKTVKIPQTIITNQMGGHQNLQVNVELPRELMMENIVSRIVPTQTMPTTQSTQSMHSSLSPSANNTPIKLNYSVDNVIPHGCLKGGLKPTYKSLKRTPSYAAPQQQPPQQQPQAPREQKLIEMQNKIKFLQEDARTNYPPEPSAPPPTAKHQLQPPPQSQPQSQLQQRSVIVDTNESSPIIFPEFDEDQEDNSSPSIAATTISNSPVIPIKQLLNDGTNISSDDINKHVKNATGPVGSGSSSSSFSSSASDLNILMPAKIKQKTKKTIKRTYTVGRSKTSNLVGVLIKDNYTRKKITNAQKELKKKPVNELKKYLREHNLIKAGSSAPNDVLRKTYESAMLAGDVVNTNEETLMHNFLHATSEF